MSEDEGSAPAVVERLVRVEAVDGRRALVTAGRMGGCGGCSEQGGCAHVALMGNRPPLSLAVENTLAVRPGEWVVIGMPAAGLLSALGWAYGLPLGGFLAGVLAGAGFGSVAALACGGAGLLAGVLAGRRRFAVRRGKDKETGEPRMLRRAEPPANGRCGNE
jgi:sigma-E factor negative regulatory protein RseC